MHWARYIFLLFGKNLWCGDNTDHRLKKIEPENQEETDHYWNALTADGGEEGPCGWLKDKFGISWQVAPGILPRLINDPDPKKSAAVMKAMMKMKKIIIHNLEEAYRNA